MGQVRVELILPRGTNAPTEDAEEDAMVYLVNFVSPGFSSATLRMPLLAGRDFTAGDTAHTQSVAIVNQTMARKFFPGDDPIGKYFATGSSEAEPQKRSFSSCGVVKDAKFTSLREDFHANGLFFPPRK